MRFEASSNDRMNKFNGMEVGIGFPKNSDGDRILYVVDAKDRRNWLVKTSPIVSVKVENYLGMAFISVNTENSQYDFTRRASEFFEEIGYDRDGNEETVLVNKLGQPVNWSDVKIGDRLKLRQMPFNKDGRPATGWSTFKISAQNLTGYWEDEYEEVF